MPLTLGPFTLDLPRLALLAGVLLSLFLALALRRRDAQGLAVLALGLIVALFAARFGYVLLHAGYYLGEPLEMLKLHKGGFLSGAGVAALLCCLVLLARRQGRPLPLAVLPALAGLGLSGALLLAFERADQQERVLPDLALRTLDGRPARLADYAGQPLVLNLWASWCPPCRQEMPLLAAAQAASPELAFLYLNQGEDAETIALYLEETGLALGEILRDPDSSASKRLPARALPTTLFVDAEGRVQDAYTGELSQPRLSDGLRRLR